MYLPAAAESGFEYREYSFYTQADRRVLYAPGRTLRKVWIMLKGFGRRLAQLPAILRSDVVYVYLEMAPLGPPVFEWLVSRLFRKPLVYDFDDAIWLETVSDYNRHFKWIKWQRKVPVICRWATVVTVGNQYLAQYASQHNEHVALIPTVVDTEHYHNRLVDQQQTPLRIGWTGTFSTLPYLKVVVPALHSIQEKYGIELVVIADKAPNLPLPYLRYVPWNKASEIEDLLSFQIGIMPLDDGPVAQGKCGFKAIQYMSLGMATIASPVGVNSSLLADDRHGLLASTTAEWMAALELLITNNALRQQMGIAARQHIVDHFSAQSQTLPFYNAIRLALSLSKN